MNIGHFVWFEINTHNPDQARAFYSELLGWGTQDMDMGGTPYTMFTAGETHESGVVPMASDDPRADHWSSYLVVEDVDAAVARAQALGGRLTVKPMDMPPGRMAGVEDANGVPVYLFKGNDPGEPGGYTRGLGRFHWNELRVDDIEKARTFYGDLIGYQVETMETPAGPYLLLNSNGHPHGGVAKAEGERRWLPWVEVDDCQAAVARAERLGGAIIAAPTEVPHVGVIARIQDPGGAELGLITPANPG